MKLINKGAVLAALAGGILLAGGGVASADAGAGGAAIGSPGVLSGNVVQIPIHIPINLCGNSIDIIAFLNPTFGNTCVNADEHGGGRPFQGADSGAMSGPAAGPASAPAAAGPASVPAATSGSGQTVGTASTGLNHMSPMVSRF